MGMSSVESLDRDFERFVEEFKAWQDAGWIVGAVVERGEIVREIRDISRAAGEEFSEDFAEELTGQWIEKLQGRRGWEKDVIKDDVIGYQGLFDFVLERV